jgi:hypothetical protein
LNHPPTAVGGIQAREENWILVSLKEQLRRKIMKLASMLALALIGIAIPFAPTKHSAPTQYRWVKAIDTGIKTWPRWVMPVANDKQRLWMVDKDGSWSSADGINWTVSANNATVALRPGAAHASFKGKLWLMGGMNDWSEFTNEIWNSSDGTSWTRVVDKAPCAARRNALVTVFKDRLWLFSGAESSGLRNVTPHRFYRDAWQSFDGLTWNKLSTTLPDSDEQVLVFNNQMWLLGSAGAWSSVDGIAWTQQSSGPPFRNRRAYGAVVYNDRMWLFGGLNGEKTTNEVWSTSDGRTWTREPDAPWFPRGGEYSVVFDGKLWIYGGKTGTHYKQADDVWYLTK